MKTALIILAILILLIAAALWLRKAIRTIIHELQNGRKSMQQSAEIIKQEAANMQLSHKECQLRLAHIQPAKMYERLEWLIPKLESAISGIESVQGKVDTMQGKINNHEKRLTDIEKIIKRWDEK